MENHPVEHVYRFCPRCGAERSDVGTIPFRCQSCGLVRFFGPVGAVGGLIINQAGELLAVRRAKNPGKGLWGLPGGFVDNGETMEAALHREVHEETGLQLVSWDYLVSFPNKYRYGGIEADVVDLFFRCRVEESSTPVLEEGELSEYRWIELKEAAELPFAFPSNQRAVAMAAELATRNG